MYRDAVKKQSTIKERRAPKGHAISEKDKKKIDKKVKALKKKYEDFQQLFGLEFEFLFGFGQFQPREHSIPLADCRPVFSTGYYWAGVMRTLNGSCSCQNSDNSCLASSNAGSATYYNPFSQNHIRFQQRGLFRRHGFSQSPFQPRSCFGGRRQQLLSILNSTTWSVSWSYLPKISISELSNRYLPPATTLGNSRLARQDAPPRWFHS